MLWFLLAALGAYFGFVFCKFAQAIHDHLNDEDEDE